MPFDAFDGEPAGLAQNSGLSLSTGQLQLRIHISTGVFLPCLVQSTANFVFSFFFLFDNACLLIRRLLEALHYGILKPARQRKYGPIFLLNESNHAPGTPHR